MITFRFKIALTSNSGEKMIYQKLNEMFIEGIELRLLNKEEFVVWLKEKVKKEHYIYLFNTLKSTTIEEIERNKNRLREDSPIQAN